METQSEKKRAAYFTEAELEFQFLFQSVTPTTSLTPSGELALSLNKRRPVVAGIPGGGSSHTPCTTSDGEKKVKYTDGWIVLLYLQKEQSVTVDEDDEHDYEETTSAVTEVDNAGRSTELPAKELYKVHLQKQIRKSDMEMDLIQLQMEEKRLLIKKAALEIELLEHRLKSMLLSVPRKVLSIILPQQLSRDHQPWEEQAGFRRG
ncbi:uncharacterized protein LOC124387892 isoform X1, partial [Tachysurus ichikawai]